MPLPTYATTALIGAGALSSYAAYEVQRLIRTYPLREAGAQHTTAGLRAAEPPHLGRYDVVCATVRLPRSTIARLAGTQGSFDASLVDGTIAADAKTNGTLHNDVHTAAAPSAPPAPFAPLASQPATPPPTRSSTPPLSETWSESDPEPTAAEPFWRDPTTPIPGTSPVLATYLSAFYRTWTLRVEGWVSRTFKFDPTPLWPEARETATRLGTYGCGLFPIVYADRDAAMVFWRAPDQEGRAFGGTQVLTATLRNTNADGKSVDQAQPENVVLDISFACAQFDPPFGIDLGRHMLWFHRMYMRFLIDHAKRTLEREAK